MENPIETSMNGVLNQSVKAQDGAIKHGETIGLKHILAAGLLAFRLAAITARNLYEAGKKLLRERRTELDAALDEARAFATLARDNLKPILGADYSEAWDEAGFVGSLRVPRDADSMVPLMQSLTDYFTANPTLEVAQRNVTAAQAGLLYEALHKANSAVNAQEGAVKDLLTDRDDKFEAVRESLRALIDELSHLIEPLDGRWLAFGFNLPGADETPDAPTSLHAKVNGTGALLDWAVAPRADYYRVWKRVIGVDKEPIAAGSPTDAGFHFDNLPANASVEIAVSAVNSGGESAQSEVVTIVTH